MKNSKRILPKKSKFKSHSEKLTHDQITEAILSFKNKGGLIKQLPPQHTFRRSEVGNRFESVYEGIFDQL